MQYVEILHIVSSNAFKLKKNFNTVDPSHMN